MKRHGFTLIEVLIAMGIIAVGLIALVTLFPVGLRSSRLAGDFTIASFIGQQALDNIRAAAQLYDPIDTFFDNTYNPRTGSISGTGNTNKNGLGYYELPISAVKGELSPIRFPTEPTRPQRWTITITDIGPTKFKVENSITGVVGTGDVGSIFTATDESIAFILYNNEDGDEFAGEYNSTYDLDYDEFEEGDEIVIHLEMQSGVPYYWYAMRAPVTEDVDLDGILDGRLPNGTLRSSPHAMVQEDIGLDLVPDFYDTNNDGSYQAGLDKPGEFTSTVTYPADPHGDNRYAYSGGWWDMANEINPDGSEGNGKIDSWPDDYLQKVTVIVGWREGGRDRAAIFSAAIPNQFR